METKHTSLLKQWLSWVNLYFGATYNSKSILFIFLHIFNVNICTNDYLHSLFFIYCFIFIFWYKSYICITDLFPYYPSKINLSLKFIKYVAKYNDWDHLLLMSIVSFNSPNSFLILLGRYFKRKKHSFLLHGFLIYLLSVLFFKRCQPLC